MTRREICAKAQIRYLVAVTTATTGTAAGTTAAATAAAGVFATGTARFHRFGFVNGQVAAVMVLAVKGVDGALAFFGAAHGDKTETAGAAGFPIHDQVGFSDSAILSEKLVQVLVGGLEGKISYVQFHTILFFFI
jgi:hypothetical protein